MTRSRRIKAAHTRASLENEGDTPDMAKSERRMGMALLAAGAAAGLVGAVVLGGDRSVSFGLARAQASPMFVDLGQFAAPIAKQNGDSGFLLVQARAQVADQPTALQVSTAMPAARHGGLRAVYDLAADGEHGLNVETAAGVILASVNDALGAELVTDVFVDRLLIQ